MLDHKHISRQAQLYVCSYIYTFFSDFTMTFLYKHFEDVVFFIGCFFQSVKITALLGGYLEGGHALIYWTIFRLPSEVKLFMAKFAYFFGAWALTNLGIKVNLG